MTGQVLEQLKKYNGFWTKFYRKFIQNFSSIAAPLNSQLKGGAKKLTWSPAVDQVFQHLKKVFIKTTILKHPKPEKPFIVEVDASEMGGGAELSQHVGIPPKCILSPSSLRSYHPQNVTMTLVTKSCSQ